MSSSPTTATVASDLLSMDGGGLVDTAHDGLTACAAESPDFEAKRENHDTQVIHTSAGAPGDRSLHELLDFPSDAETSRASFSSSSSSSSSSPVARRSSAATVAATTTTTAAPKLTCSRARQLCEIKALRKQEQELREMLTRLQQAPSLRRASPLAALVESVAEDASARKLVWQSVAKCERDTLKRSQHENLRLRSSIVELKRLTKTVRRMVTNRAVKSAVYGEHLLHEIPNANLSLSPDDHAMFRELLADIYAIQADADTKVQALANTTAPNNPVRDWQMHRNADGSQVLEMIVYDELPFRKAEIEQAHVILHKETEKCHRRFVPEHFGGRQDEAVKVELVNTNMSSGVGMYRQLHATHVVKEEKHTMVSAVGYIDSVDAHGRPTAGFLLKMQAWGLHTQHTRVDPRTGREQHLTVIHFRSSLTAVQVRGPDSLRWDESTARHSIIPIWEREMSANQRRLENVLFDRVASARA